MPFLFHGFFYCNTFFNNGNVCQQFCDSPSRLSDFIGRIGAELVGLNTYWPGYFSISKNFHQFGAMREASFINVLNTDILLVRKSLLQGIEIDRLINNFKKRIFETVFWQTTLQWHLATLKTRAYATAGTGILPLVSTTGCATKARTLAAANAAPCLALFRERIKLMKLHVFLLLTLFHYGNKVRNLADYAANGRRVIKSFNFVHFFQAKGIKHFTLMRCGADAGTHQFYTYLLHRLLPYSFQLHAAQGRNFCGAAKVHQPFHGCPKDIMGIIGANGLG